MNELQGDVEQAYEAAKSGHWDRLLSMWADFDVLAKHCSRFTKPGSGWSFLHQAAYFGNQQACRALIGQGASTEALTHGSRTPAEVAEHKGHHELAVFLRNASMGRGTLWAPSMDPDTLPSSNRWEEATQTQADAGLLVAYGGGLVKIAKGTPHFVDALGRVLVGWHGTFNPPCGMDGESMLS